MTWEATSSVADNEDAVDRLLSMIAPWTWVCTTCCTVWNTVSFVAICQSFIKFLPRYAYYQIWICLVMYAYLHICIYICQKYTSHMYIYIYPHPHLIFKNIMKHTHTETHTHTRTPFWDESARQICHGFRLAFYLALDKHKDHVITSYLSWSTIVV